MPEFASIGYNLVQIKIAALDTADYTFGTPVELEYGQELGFEAAADNQELKAYGLTVQLLSVITHFTGTLSQGLIDVNAYSILVGEASVDSGSPVTQSTLDYLVGGAGLPYFGLIGRLASVGGADIHLGFPMCKLDRVPNFQIRQNEFIMPSSGIKMIAPDTTTRKAARLRRHVTTTAITADFDAFFTGIMPA